MPNRIYIAVTIALVTISALVTARVVGQSGSSDATSELAFRVKMQCESWARELDKAADAYETHARAPGTADLPFGAEHRERVLVAGRVAIEQKFCRFVRKRDGADVGQNEVDEASALFVSATSQDPATLAQAIRRLADAAKRDGTLEVGP